MAGCVYDLLEIRKISSNVERSVVMVKLLRLNYGIL